MIDIAVSIVATSGESDAFSASIRVSAGKQAQPEGPATRRDREWLGNGPLLPDDAATYHVPGFSPAALNRAAA